MLRDLESKYRTEGDNVNAGLADIIAEDIEREAEANSQQKPRDDRDAVAGDKLPAVVAYIERNGKLLSISRKDTGECAVPGGKCESGEPPFQALIREVREEIGVRIVSATRVYCGRHTSGRVVIAYRCEIEGEPVAVEDGTRAEWVTPDAIANGFGAEYHRLALVAAGYLPDRDDDRTCLLSQKQDAEQIEERPDHSENETNEDERAAVRLAYEMWCAAEGRTPEANGEIHWIVIEGVYEARRWFRAARLAIGRLSGHSLPTPYPSRARIEAARRRLEKCLPEVAVLLGDAGARSLQILLGATVEPTDAELTDEAVCLGLSSIVAYKMGARREGAQ
jgi:8-oxo-dGTP diphosphatase